MERYVSRYAESVKPKSKKAILESVKIKISKIKESLKKFKEDEAKELEKVVSEIEDVVISAIDAVGIENPAVDTLVTAGQEIATQSDIVEEPVIV